MRLPAETQTPGIPMADARRGGHAASTSASQGAARPGAAAAGAPVRGTAQDWVWQSVFDFQSDADAGAWQIVNDSVMGGVSASRFEVEDGVAVFSGEVSLANNGGFASVRSLPARHELAGCQAFLLRARGDGRRYKFTARMGASLDTALHQVAFATEAGEWQDHWLPVGSFVPTFRGRRLHGEPPLDPGRVVSVGFLISDRQAGPFRLEVAWIRAGSSAAPNA